MKKLFEIVFQVTETLQNGKERTIRKSVYSERFVGGKFYTEEQRIADATELLKAHHYYNIEYIGTKAISMLML